LKALVLRTQARKALVIKMNAQLDRLEILKRDLSPNPSPANPTQLSSNPRVDGATVTPQQVIHEGEPELIPPLIKREGPEGEVKVRPFFPVWY
jgi:hypothetical protein